jgi:streptogramin lyase
LHRILSAGWAAVLACAGAAAAAPEAGALGGRVEDARGDAVAGAMVSALLPGGRSVTVYSDAAGSFRLPPEADGAERLQARLPGTGTASAEPAPEARLRLSDGDPVLPAPSAWLAGLPAGEPARRFILDCTGCHVTDSERLEVRGLPRDSTSWHAAVEQMKAMFGPGTGFPIMSEWANPENLAGWCARSFRDVRPEHSALRGPEDGGAVLTEHPVPVPQDLAHDLMVDPSGAVLITGMFTHQMYRLDPAAGVFDVTPIPVPGANPRALDVDARGRWWVVLGGPGKVAVYDPPRAEWELHDVGMYAHSIAVGPDGRAWVNGHFSHDPELIAAVDGDSGEIARFPVPAAGGGTPAESTIPYGLRVARDGSVWGTQLRGNRLIRLDPATGDVKQWEMPVTHSGPRRPDVAPDGSVWIPLYSADALVRFDPATERFRKWDFPVPGALPYVVRIDQRDGTVWIGTGHGDVVASFDPRTERFRLYPLPTRGALIRHLDVDESRGEIWFAYGASPGIPGKVMRLRP